MFSLKEWNFEEYKAAVKEIEDPVDRLDELNATRGFAFIEEMESHRVRKCRILCRKKHLSSNG